MDQAVCRPSLILDEPVPVSIAEVVDPGEGGLDVRPDRRGELSVGGSLIVSSGQEHEKRGRVHAPVIAAEWHLSECRHLAVAGLMQHLSRLGVLQWNDLGRLGRCQVFEDAPGQLGPERQALVAR